MFPCVQKPLSWQCLQLDSAFWRRGAPSGVCGAWKAAAVSGTFLNPQGRVGCLGFDIHLPPNVYFLCSW